MATYTGTADSSGNYTVNFGGTSYTSAEHVSVTADDGSATKTVELYAPSSATGGAISFSGTLTDFPNNIGEITLSAGISGTIKAKSFMGNSSDDNMFCKATGLIIQGSVTTIEANAFDGWVKAIKLTLPSTLTTIGYYAFSEFGADSTTDFDITLPNAVTTLGAYSFNDCGVKNFDIGTGVTSIPDNCFRYTLKLSTFNFRNVTSIGVNAFYSSNLSLLTIPNTITTISDGAFYFCKATDINTGNGITTIENSAFSQCISCTKFTIGSAVTSIEYNGMSYLSACNELHCLPTTPPTITTNSLIGLKSTCSIKVPSASLTAYQTATNWSAYSSQMVGV